MPLYVCAHQSMTCKRSTAGAGSKYLPLIAATSICIGPSNRWSQRCYITMNCKESNIGRTTHSLEQASQLFPLGDTLKTVRFPTVHQIIYRCKTVSACECMYSCTYVCMHVDKPMQKICSTFFLKTSLRFFFIFPIQHYVFYISVHRYFNHQT
jgi:hypothetical protein